MTWFEACEKDDIDEEDLIDIEYQGQYYAIYRSEDDEFFATAGLCTHECTRLADGLVMDDVIECPKHNGRFNFKTGKALGAPVTIDLKTYPVKIDGDKVLIDIE